MIKKIVPKKKNLTTQKKIAKKKGIKKKISQKN
jgi:hypothetical protein